MGVYSKLVVYSKLLFTVNGMFTVNKGLVDFENSRK